MDDASVQEQLDHMVKFIFREADEKAAEIGAKANEEFAIEKARIVQEEKLKIAAEFERKRKQIDVQKRIERSNELNQSRLKVLKAREEALQALLKETHAELGQFSKENPAEYKKLLSDLVVESIVKLGAQDIVLVCREEDKDLLMGVIPGAVDEAAGKVGFKANCTLNTRGFLPAGPTSPGAPFCSGGILASANDGKMMLSNTLDARLGLAFTGLTPMIREELYGKRKTSADAAGGAAADAALIDM